MEGSILSDVSIVIFAMEKVAHSTRLPAMSVMSG